jgi:hypothetical protein
VCLSNDQDVSCCTLSLIPCLVADLNRLEAGTAPERRIATITTACALFDHHSDFKHDAELRYGAASILTRELLNTDVPDETRMLCAALEMVFRGNPQRQMLSSAYLDKPVQSFLVQSLLRVLEEYEDGGSSQQSPTQFTLVTILNISKILFYLSRCELLRASLAREKGLLQAISRAVTSRSLNPECRLVRMQTAAQLSHSNANKEIMYQHQGLVDNLLRAGHFDASDPTRQEIAVTLVNLASASANQVDMANNDTVLATLVKMVLLETNPATREATVAALQNLAYNKACRRRMVTFRDGIVLQALKKALSNDLHARARRRAASALTNLVAADTGEAIGNYKGLLDTMALVSTKDSNLEVQSRTALALCKLSNFITSQMQCYETLLDALVVSSLSSAPNNVSSVLRIKARDPANRETLANHPGVLDTLADLVVSEGTDLKDRQNALRTIMHLTNEPRNHKIMCSSTILDALVVGSTLESPRDEDGLHTPECCSISEHDKGMDMTIDSGDRNINVDHSYAQSAGTNWEMARDSSIRALERLATETSNRPIMARHDRLIVTVARAVEREVKLQTGSRGAPPDAANCLAKPLLMSLLLAL